MKFEERFPSLAHPKGFDVSDQKGDADTLFTNIEVQEFCLDKQRVKEVVTAYLDNYQCRKNKQTKLNRDGILKELGIFAN